VQRREPPLELAIPTHDQDGSLWSTGLAGAASTNTGAAHTPSQLVADSNVDHLLHKTVGRLVQFTVDPG
jgi:hypothetical protein